MDVLVQGYVRQITDDSYFSLEDISNIIVQYNIAKRNVYPSDCVLFGVGNNGSGEMGLGHDQEVEYLTPLYAFNEFKHIFIGFETIFTIDSSHTVSAAGNNYCGRLGVQPYKSPEEEDDSDSEDDYDQFSDQIITPQTVTSLESKRINLISQGLHNDHCFFYDSTSRQLWANGPNEFGQLGNGKQSEQSEQSRTESHSESGKLEFVSMPWDSTKIQLIDIQCGMYSTLFLTDDGSVWSCGSNESGTLGIGKPEDDKSDDYIRTITRIPMNEFPNTKITKIGCLENSCILLDKDGNLYVFGANYYGALGILDDTDSPMEYDEYIQWTPTVIPYFKERGIKIVDFDCGDHICCLDHKNNVYLWGRNDRNQCGNGKVDRNVLIPMELDLTPFHPSKEREIIQSVHCGLNHTVLLTVRGNLFVWGNNNNGECMFSPYDEIPGSVDDESDEKEERLEDQSDDTLSGEMSANTGSKLKKPINQMNQCIVMLDELIDLFGHDDRPWPKGVVICGCSAPMRCITLREWDQLMNNGNVSTDANTLNNLDSVQCDECKREFVVSHDDHDDNESLFHCMLDTAESGPKIHADYCLDCGRNQEQIMQRGFDHEEYVDRAKLMQEIKMVEDEKRITQNTLKRLAKQHGNGNVVDEVVARQMERLQGELRSLQRVSDGLRSTMKMTAEERMRELDMLDAMMDEVMLNDENGIIEIVDETDEEEKEQSDGDGDGDGDGDEVYENDDVLLDEFDEILVSGKDPTIVYEPKYLSREDIVKEIKSERRMVDRSDSWLFSSELMILDVLCGPESTFLIMKAMK